MTLSIRAAVAALALTSTAALAVAPSNIVQTVDESAIAELVTKQVQAWNARDVEAWAEYFAPDATFTDWRGAGAQGRDAIRTLQATTFGNPTARGTLKVIDLQIRFPAREVATAQRQDVLTSSGAADGPGEQRYSTLLVLRKESGRWSIEAMQTVRQLGASR
jgi:uncharacterized protein (TIGR02246 family)